MRETFTHYKYNKDLKSIYYTCFTTHFIRPNHRVTKSNNHKMKKGDVING